MATRWAVATGLWSNTATWNGGTLPTSADDVHANTFTVTVDQNITVLSLRTTSATGVTAGGGFALGNGFTITCTGAGLVPGSSTCVTYAGSSATTITSAISGSSTTTGVGGLSLTGSGNVTVNGTVSGSYWGVGITATVLTGTLTVFGNVTGGTTGNNNITAHGINGTGASCFVTGIVTSGTSTWGTFAGNGINATSAVTVTGNVVAAPGNDGNATAGISSAFAITVTGNVTGGPNTNKFGISHSGTGNSVTITGNVTAGTGNNSHGANISGNSTTKLNTIIGTVTATAAATGLGSHGVIDTNNAGGWTVVGGSLIDSPQGDCAVNARRFRCIPTLNTIRQHANNTGYPSGGSVVYGSLDYIPNNVPVPADVRSGVVYGNNTFTGTCTVPVAGSVALGVPVDNTIGTAVLTPSAVWDTLTSTMLTPGSIGERLSNCATVQTTGDQIAAANP